MTDPLELLRSTLTGQGRPTPLSPARYSRAHATYEAHSDQRARLTAWLAGSLPGLLPGSGPRSVLSIGPGDGSVDGPLAAGLVAGRAGVRWTAAEPDAAVGARCRDRVAAALVDAGGHGGSVVLHPGPFGTLPDTVGADTFDLVLAVHSLYYVPDLDAALAEARARLAPGGTLVALLAPLEDLCRLTEAVDPGSHRWWSGDLQESLTDAGWSRRTTRLAGRLDVTDCADPTSDDGADVLDFLVGADCSQLGVAARAALLDVLAAISTTEAGRHFVPHPVDAVVAVPS